MLEFPQAVVRNITRSQDMSDWFRPKLFNIDDILRVADVLLARILPKIKEVVPISTQNDVTDLRPLINSPMLFAENFMQRNNEYGD